MNILGVGPLELIFIIIIALIILGPKDIGKAGLTIGRWLRRVMTSETWHIIRGTSSEIRNLPNRLMREAGLEDIKKDLPTEDELRKAMSFDEIEKVANQVSTDLNDWTTPTPTPTILSAQKQKEASPTRTSTPVPEKKAFPEPKESDWTAPRQRFTQLDQTIDEKNSDSLDEADKSDEKNSEKPTYPPPLETN